MLTQAVNLPESRRAHPASTFDNFLLTRVCIINKYNANILVCSGVDV